MLTNCNEQTVFKVFRAPICKQIAAVEVSHRTSVLIHFRQIPELKPPETRQGWREGTRSLTLTHLNLEPQKSKFDLMKGKLGESVSRGTSTSLRSS